MSRKISAFFTAFALVFLCGCSADAPDADELCKNIATEYTCILNITDESGSALFGGRLAHSEGGYEFTLVFPEDTAGTVFCISGGAVVAKLGGETVPLPESAVQRLLVPLGVLDTALSEGDELSPYRSELYGSKCGICDIDGKLLYFANGVPLLIISNGTRAEITGFSAQSQ